MSVLTVVWAVVLGGVVGGALVSLGFMRHGQAQMRKLAARLDTLEQRWTLQPSEQPAASSSRPDPSAGNDADNHVTPTDDVLAGLTTHVERLVSTGRGAECLADQAILVVYRRLDESLSPAQVANALHVSLRTLQRGIALSLDCTPSQLIVAAKMREANRLLSAGGVRVADVADRLGFANPFHFSRRFKSFYGFPPSECQGRRV